MTNLPPLQFKPILREYLWGGRRLAELGKPLGNAERYAESWDVVDHGDDQSVVADGPFAGVKLRELVHSHGQPLLGRHHPLTQFPLLFKFLDCQRTLSVQVHPNDVQAKKLDPPDLGKTEAWVVLDAAPGSRVYAGLKPGVDRNVLQRELEAGNCESCLHEFEPRVGDCVFIEAGTVHALGAGLLVAEIQQASDTTFRLFDWNRLDKDGKPRPLHVRESLETIDFLRGPVDPQTPQPTAQPNVERLVASQKFILDRWRLETRERLVRDNRFHILAFVEGTGTLASSHGEHEYRRGDTWLLPASSSDVEINPADPSVVLDCYLPWW